MSARAHTNTHRITDNISNICCSSSTYTDRCSSSTLVHIQTDAVTVGLICKDRQMVQQQSIYSKDRCCSSSPYIQYRQMLQLQSIYFRERCCIAVVHIETYVVAVVQIQYRQMLQQQSIQREVLQQCSSSPYRDICCIVVAVVQIL